MSDLAATIRSVTDLWDEPLDEVRDVPQIVNAILASDWLAAEKAKWQAEERERIAAAIDDAARRAAETADPGATAAAMRMAAVAAFDAAARIARQGGSDG